MDSNLLKEAIADAKAVRQTALANAKVALEEAFSERYHAMFADKLKEDANQGNFQANSNDTLEKTVDEEENINGKEIDELIKELESEVGGDSTQAEPNLSGDASSQGEDSASGINDVPPAPDATPIPPGYKAAPDAIVPIDSNPDASTPPAVPGASDTSTSTPPSSTPPPSSNNDMDEDINLDELLENLKEEINADKEDKEETKEETIEEDKKLSSSAIGGKTGGSDNKKPSSSASSTSKIESAGVDKDGYPAGDAKTIAKDATTASRPNQGKNVTSTNLSTPSAGGTSGPALKATRPNSKGDFENTAKLTEENESLKTQLNEAENTIKYVKGQLNEINLLNAKLLYTNKLFKEYNMNNEQKMRIVEMFDLSKNVREVKLTYANLAESLNFGGIDIKRKNASASNANVRSITEGLASKPVGSTKPTKDIISESKSAMVSKFQKLAGIKNK